MTDRPDPTLGTGWSSPPQPAALPPQPAALPPQPAALPPQPAAPAAPGHWGASGTWASPAGPGAPAPVPPQPAPAAAAPGWTTGTTPGWTTGPVPGSTPPRPRSTSGRTSIAVLAIILGVVVGANVVNAALPLPEDPAPIAGVPAIPVEAAPTSPDEPAATLSPVRTLAPLESAPPAPPTIEPGPVSAGQGVDVGAGFVLFPPDGWTALGSDAGIVIQKSGVLVIAVGFSWEGSAVDLAASYRDAWFAGGELSGDDPQAGSLGSGIPAAGLSYTGLWNGGQVDGAIIAGALEGSGLVVNVVGPTGSLTGVSDDLDTILDTVRYTGG